VGVVVIEPDEEWLEQQVIRGGDALARMYGDWTWSLDRWRSIAAVVLVASGDPLPASGDPGSLPGTPTSR